ncbi:hypothetical protein Bca4012_064199 [Brassica carinata]
MLSYVCDSEYGIPRRCPCGGRIIDEVRRRDDYDTLPGKRFFTCKNYEVRFSKLIFDYVLNLTISYVCLCCLIFDYVVTKADGLHYRQPWVLGVQEEIERLTKRVEEAEEVMLGASNLGRQIDRLEVCDLHVQEQVKLLTEQVDFLTVQVATLEKVAD